MGEGPRSWGVGEGERKVANKRKDSERKMPRLLVGAGLGSRGGERGEGGRGEGRGVSRGAGLWT